MKRFMAYVPESIHICKKKQEKTWTIFGLSKLKIATFFDGQRFMVFVPKACIYLQT